MHMRTSQNPHAMRSGEASIGAGHHAPTHSGGSMHFDLETWVMGAAFAIAFYAMFVSFTQDPF
ncbi:MAG: hypothetical protein N838_09750 [Thiohalocapsa sp. PB-PSB1]|nr:MAG: hypothetical protein N838_09750 [Thiohalocapsa sp. PB-PSB1]